METKFLLPNRFKKIGWFLFVPGLLMTIVSLFISTFFPNQDLLKSFNFLGEDHIFKHITTIHHFRNSIKPFEGAENEDLANEIVMTLVALGFLWVAFSREKQEDEWVAKIRLESLLIGFYAYVILFIMGVWLIYWDNFLNFLYWSLLVAPVVFLIRFHWFVYIKPYLEERRAAV